MIFTNSADQLRAALDRSVDKEMAVEAVRESRNRDSLSREEWERLVSPLSREATSLQTFDQGSMSNSCEGATGNERAAGEEMELDLSS